jgi:hypothetical protein
VCGLLTGREIRRIRTKLKQNDLYKIPDLVAFTRKGKLQLLEYMLM